MFLVIIYAEMHASKIIHLCTEISEPLAYSTRLYSLAFTIYFWQTKAYMTKVQLYMTHVSMIESAKRQERNALAKHTQLDAASAAPYCP